MNFVDIRNRMIAGLLAVALSGGLQVAQAWQQPSGGETQSVPAPTPAPTTPAPATGTVPDQATPPPTQGAAPEQAAPSQQGAPAARSGTTVDPAQGPLEPAPSEAAPESLPSAETPAQTSP